MGRQRRATTRALRVLAGCALFAALPTLARATAVPLERERTSVARDITSTNVTVYAGGLALVHDRRRIVLPRGEQRLAWRDVSASLRPETAELVEPSRPRDLSILEQNFDFDVLGGPAILAKYVGRELTVTHPLEERGRPHRETARVVTAADGNIVLQYRNRVETQIDGSISFPAVPPDLRDHPTLVVDLKTASSGAHDFDLGYLTDGIDWYATYTGVVARDGATMDLTGLVTLTNTSGATFRNARLQLVAGDVHLPPSIVEKSGLVNAGQGTDAYTVTPVAKPVEESFGQYHLYTVRRRTTIEQRQTKQVLLLNARAVPIHETLEVRDVPEERGRKLADESTAVRVAAFVTFRNERGDLGVPLPSGTVRLYRTTADGATSYLAAQSIPHTPAREDVRLRVGDSFDVTARRRELDASVSGGVHTSSDEVVLANAKTEPVDVLVVEPIPCEWTIVRSSLPFVKSSSATATWSVRVAPGEHRTLTYTSHYHC